MAGHGPAPKVARRRTNEPTRGDWSAPTATGWQFGPIPRPPTGLQAASRDAWQTWFTAWFAAHWAPEDVPMLRQIVKLYDQVERGAATAAQQSELRQLADSYGITKKGQQDRRWTRPKPDEALPVAPTPTSGKYARLKAVS